MKRMKTIGRIAAFTLMLAVFPNVTSAASFTDVSTNHGAKKEIEFLVDQGVIKGFQDGTFKPQNQVTKANVATMLARALKLDTTNVKNPKLTDVPTTHGSYKEIVAVVNAGIMPVDGGVFNPGTPITRGEMARAVTHAFKLQGNGNTSFSDVAANYWAYKYIDALAANGITIGFEDGTFRPTASLTRAQFSSFLARALDPSFVKTKNTAVSEVSTITTVSASKKPVDSTDKVDFSLNKNYIYTYKVRTYPGSNEHWHKEVVMAAGEADSNGWIKWEKHVAGKSTYKFETRSTGKNFEYTLPQQGNVSGGHVYKLPYDKKVGDTWTERDAQYKLLEIKKTYRIDAGEFKNVYVIESVENNVKEITYYAQNFGEIVKLSADGQVKSEIKERHLAR